MKMTKVTPDDVVVISCETALGWQKTEHIVNQFKEAFGTKKVIFLDEGISFEVVKTTTVFQEQVEEALENGNKIL